MAGAERAEAVALEEGLLAPEVSSLDHFHSPSSWPVLLTYRGSVYLCLDFLDVPVRFGSLF